jgi:hypothetical protein
MSEPLRGSCYCQAVQYQADGLSSPVGHCHCTTCRKIHAAAFNSSALTPYDGFQWTKGADLVRYIETSPGKRRWFCPQCGSHLVAEYPSARIRVLRVGSLDSPGLGPAAAHIWTSEKADFFEFDDGLPRLAEGAAK